MPTLATQEREAADIFNRADRRGPPTNAVVSLSSPSLSVVLISRTAHW